MDETKFISGRIVERLDVSDDLAVFRIAPDEECHFTPGQFATLGLPSADGKLVERAYSIASSPLEKHLEFFIELVPEGRLTPSLFLLNMGDRVFIRRKFSGRFTLDEGAIVHLMAATVTGVAPYLSILRTRATLLRRSASEAAERVNRFLVVHGAGRSQELGIYRVELETLAREFAFITYVPTVSRFSEDAEWMGEVGRVEDVLRKHADKLMSGSPDSVVAAYLCGHPQMIENARGILARCRVPSERIHEEKYFTVKSPR